MGKYDVQQRAFEKAGLKPDRIDPDSYDTTADYVRTAALCLHNIICAKHCRNPKMKNIVDTFLEGHPDGTAAELKEVITKMDNGDFGSIEVDEEDPNTFYVVSRGKKKTKRKSYKFSGLAAQLSRAKSRRKSRA